MYEELHNHSEMPLGSLHSRLSELTELQRIPHSEERWRQIDVELARIGFELIWREQNNVLQ
jgi:hypothetical protein